MIVPRRPDASSPGPERPGRILTNGWQLSQGGPGRRGHTAKLPADLIADSLLRVRAGKSSRLGGIRGGAQGVRAHVRDAGGLPGRSRGSHRCGSAHLTRGGMSDETAAGLSRRQAPHEQRPVAGRSRHGAGYPPEPPPRTIPAPAPRNPPPTPQRFVGQLRSASAETHTRIFPRVSSPLCRRRRD